MSVFKSIVVLWFAALVLPGFCAAAESLKGAEPSELTLEAGRAYKAGEFGEAVRLYDQVIAGGLVNGHLFYNLGNAHLKNGQVGKAILSYRKAQMMIPRNEDLRANLEYALGLTRDKIECRELLTFLTDFCFWYSGLNAAELAAVFLLANGLLWAVMALKAFYKKDMLTVLMVISLFAAVVLGGSLGAKLYNTRFNPRGVVVAREIMVRSGSSVNDTVLFKLHEGAEFSWVRKEPGWVQIRLCDGKRGWVQEEVVGKIEINS